MTVTPLGWDQDCSLKIREPEVPAPFWFLNPGGWSKTAAVGLYFIFPGICTLSLNLSSVVSIHIRQLITPRPEDLMLSSDLYRKLPAFAFSRSSFRSLGKRPQHTDNSDAASRGQGGLCGEPDLLELVKGLVLWKGTLRISMTQGGCGILERTSGVVKARSQEGPGIGQTDTEGLQDGFLFINNEVPPSHGLLTKFIEADMMSLLWSQTQVQTKCVRCFAWFICLQNVDVGKCVELMAGR
ncbi:hypothetical protein STEG23_017566, partial [Scotinomys teguina]